MSDIKSSKGQTTFSLDNKNVNTTKHRIGFIIYFIVFVVVIPYILFKNELWGILAAYMPNLDLLATIISYHGGPMDSSIWKHLYSPTDPSFDGYVSRELINYFSLLGITYLIAKQTHKNKSVFKGWSWAFIMLITYFISNNYVLFYMEEFGEYLNPYLMAETLTHYLLVIIAGLLMSVIIVLGETFLIKNLSPYIVKIVDFFI